MPTSIACEWYSVNEALPIDDRQVLVTYRKASHARDRHCVRRSRRRIIVTFAVFGDDTQWHFTQGPFRSSAHPENITHWMPLPKPVLTRRRGWPRELRTVL